MTAERFDDAMRRLQGALTRRTALGALLGVGLATLVGNAGEARRWPKPGKKRGAKKGKRKQKRDGSGKKKKDKKKKDKKKKDK
ncbi:MAG: hypothetical protein KC442_17280, partial [Thermomicrobiales bacterium]|nr:hypothetical protein [Thermomicrobiales bacterium]